MKIRIADRVFEIDEKTLGDWIRLGRVPLDASVFIETPKGGAWASVRELAPVRQFWSVDENADARIHDLQALQSEQRFAAYQRRRPRVTWALIFINVAIFLTLDQFVGRIHNTQVLIQAGAYYYPLILKGEYWRLVTSNFLHGNLLHLTLNMLLLFVAGNLIEGLYGHRRFTILYLIAGLGGSLASLPFVQDAPGVGASGAIFGLMGAIVALGFRYRDRIPSRRGRIFGVYLLPFITIDFLLGLVVIPAFKELYGLNVPSINNAAHFGGLAAGFLMAMVMAPEIYADRENESTSIKALAAVLVALTFVSGLMPVASRMAGSPEPDERSTAPSFTLPSAEELPEYIERYEAEIEKGRFDLREYQILEALYIEAYKNEPNDPRWEEKLRTFYARALTEDSDNRAWSNGLLRLYVDAVAEKPDEQARLAGYIHMCEQIEGQKGYHEPIYQALHFFYLRAKELAPEQTAWLATLKDFYQKALESDSGHPLWNGGLHQLYVESVAELSPADEKAVLGEYIAFVQRLEKKHGYHQALYSTLQSFYMQAQTLALEGDWITTLEKLYIRAVKSDPKNPTWNNNLAWHYVEQRTQPKKAVALALDAIREQPSSPTFLDTLGWAYMRDKQHRKALRTFEQVFSQRTRESDSNEEIEKAKVSSWDGMVELIEAVQSDTDPEFERAFEQFYQRLSRRLPADSPDRTRLEDVFRAYRKGRD